MFLTKEELFRAGACTKQYDIFVSVWPDGVEITPEVVYKALELELDMMFFVRRILGVDNENLLVLYCGCPTCNIPRSTLVKRLMAAITVYEEGL